MLKKIINSCFGRENQVPGAGMVVEQQPQPREEQKSPTHVVLQRETVAEHYLKGEGIEIGALHKPLKIPETASVRYVDRMSEANLRHDYPELASLPLVHVDVIDDGEKLSTFTDSSLNFVIANHFLEHSQDPIGTIKNMMRVLKPGGVLYMAVPDKRYTFDRERSITTMQHLLDDHQNGPAATKLGHFEEYARFVSHAYGDGLKGEIKRLLDMDYSIHFHVWDKRALTEFLNSMQDEIGYDMVFSMQIDIEVLNILIKR